MEVSVSDVDNYPSHMSINDAYPQPPIVDVSPSFQQTPVNDDSLQPTSVHDFVQTSVDDNYPSDSSTESEDNKVSSWEVLPEELQAVLPNQSQYTYAIENFKPLPCEKFVGAPKHAFEVEARINISHC